MDKHMLLSESNTDEKTYSIIIAKHPETNGLAIFQRVDGEYSTNGEMLVWSGLTWEEADKKRKELKYSLLSSYEQNFIAISQSRRVCPYLASKH
jgi:hypothetical protein